MPPIRPMPMITSAPARIQTDETPDARRRVRQASDDEQGADEIDDHVGHGGRLSSSRVEARVRPRRGASANTHFGDEGRAGRGAAYPTSAGQWLSTARTSSSVVNSPRGSSRNREPRPRRAHHRLRRRPHRRRAARPPAGATRSGPGPGTPPTPYIAPAMIDITSAQQVVGATLRIADHRQHGPLRLRRHVGRRSPAWPRCPSAPDGRRPRPC